MLAVKGNRPGFPIVPYSILIGYITHTILRQVTRSNMYIKLIL